MSVGFLVESCVRPVGAAILGGERAEMRAVLMVFLRSRAAFGAVFSWRKAGLRVTRLDVLRRAGAAAAGVVFAPLLARVPADVAAVERRAEAQSVAQFRAFQKGYADAMRRMLEARGCLRSGEAAYRLERAEVAA